MITDLESHPPSASGPLCVDNSQGTLDGLASKSVPDSQFTLKASVRGLELMIRGNPGITGASDADKFTENLCTEVSGGEFSGTLLVAGKWIRRSASLPVGLKRMQNNMNIKTCAGNKDLTAQSVVSIRSLGRQWNLVTPQERMKMKIRSSGSQENHHQITMKSAFVIL